MSIDRSTILRGPAAIVFGSQVIYTKDDIKVEVGLSTFPVDSAAYGKVDERLDDIVTKITFTPVGKWTTGLLAVLYPHTNPIAGTSLFGASDTPCTIWPLNGSESIEWAAAAITKMPSLILSTTKTAFGAMEITCLGKNNTATTSSSKRFTLTATDAFDDTSFLVSEIKTVPYTVALASASAPWDSILTAEGLTVDFDLQTSPVKVDDEGIVDLTLSGLNIGVKFMPVKPTAADVLAKLQIQGSGVLRGMSLAAGAANLTASGGSGNPTVTVNGVRLKSAPQVYGAKALRHGELEWIATRAAGTGAMFSVGVVS